MDLRGGAGGWAGRKSMRSQERSCLNRAYTLAEAEETMAKMLTTPPYGLQAGDPSMSIRPPGRPEEQLAPTKPQCQEFLPKTQRAARMVLFGASLRLATLALKKGCLWYVEAFKAGCG